MPPRGRGWSRWSPIVLALVLSGLGLGGASVATTAGTSAAGDTDQGVAAGLLNAVPQLGSALGTATATALPAAYLLTTALGPRRRPRLHRPTRVALNRV